MSADLTSRRSRRATRSAQQLLPAPVRVVILAVVSFAVLVPIAYVLVLSLTPDVEFAQGKLIPQHWDFGNYATIWHDVPLARGFMNSLIIAGLSAALAVVVASCAAYPLAHYRFRSRRQLLYGILALQVVPSTMVLLPFFAIFAALQTLLGVTIIGSYWLLVVTYLTFALPFATWLMYTYVRALPRELEEAALVDGASHLGALFRIMLPLAAPGMVVAFVFSALVGWNDVLFANVLTNEGTRTLAVDLQLFSFTQQGSTLPLYSELMAAGVLASIPVVLAYLALQRFLVSGLAKGAIQ